MASLLFMYLKVQVSLMVTVFFSFTMAMKQFDDEPGGLIEPQLEVIPADEAKPKDKPAEEE